MVGGLEYCRVETTVFGKNGKNCYFCCTFNKIVMIEWWLLERERRLKGIKKGKIAKEAGISARLVGLILSGKGNPRLSELEGVLKALGKELAVGRGFSEGEAISALREAGMFLMIK